jgi:GT2 family glycosyltransferase
MLAAERIRRHLREIQALPVPLVYFRSYWEEHMTTVPSIDRPTGLVADVVICAYTDRRWEQLCLAVESAQVQTVSPGQILVCVDHNDELADRCDQRWPMSGQSAVPHVRVLRNRYPGRLGSARNTAIEHVSADVIAFLDDDARAEPTWLEHLLLVFEEDGAVAVGGAPQPVFETKRPTWFPEEFQWVFGCHYTGLPEQRSPTPHLIGASMSVRADAIRELNGFRSDNHDDMDLSHRVLATYGKDSVIYEPRARVLHYVTAERVTWKYFWRRCFFVNRGKVRAFHDMGHAGNISAELAFARRMAGSVLRRLVRGLRGDVAAVQQAAAIVAGVGLAGLGHLVGRVDLLVGKTPEPLTRGLQPTSASGTEAA